MTIHPDQYDPFKSKQFFNILTGFQDDISRCSLNVTEKQGQIDIHIYIAYKKLLSLIRSQFVYPVLLISSVERVKNIYGIWLVFVHPLPIIIP